MKKLFPENGRRHKIKEQWDSVSIHFPLHDNIEGVEGAC